MPNYISDEAKKRARRAFGVGGADYAQNDPNGEGYIKNRPFYSQKETYTLCENLHHVPTEENNFSTAFGLSMIPNVGDVATIIFNGNTHTAIAENFDGIITVIFYENESGVLVSQFNTMPDGTMMGAVICNQEGVCSLSVEHETIHKVDSRFIAFPNGYIQPLSLSKIWSNFFFEITEITQNIEELEFEISDAEFDALCEASKMSCNGDAVLFSGSPNIAVDRFVFRNDIQSGDDMCECIEFIFSRLDGMYYETWRGLIERRNPSNRYVKYIEHEFVYLNE